MEYSSFENWVDKTPAKKRKEHTRRKKVKTKISKSPEYWKTLTKIYGVKRNIFRFEKIENEKAESLIEKKLEKLYELFYTIVRVKDFEKLKGHTIIKNHFNEKDLSNEEQFQKAFYEFIKKNKKLIDKLRTSLEEDINRLETIKGKTKKIYKFGGRRDTSIEDIYNDEVFKKYFPKSSKNIPKPSTKIEFKKILSNTTTKLTHKIKELKKILNLLDILFHKQTKITDF